VITTANDLRQLYAIYTHADNDGIVQYVGVCPLSELFTLKDALCNSIWPKKFGSPMQTLEMNVVALTADEREAYNEQRKLIATHNPECNKRGFYVEPKKQAVVCIETGEKFATISEACRAHNLSYPALHGHLSRKPGFKTVKGKTYRREFQP
jgi:hypothetical protein